MEMYNVVTGIILRWLIHMHRHRLHIWTVSLLGNQRHIDI